MVQVGAAAINRVDVAVIGGGIAGVAIAEYVARHTNLSVQLLEKNSHLGEIPPANWRAGSIRELCIRVRMMARLF
ncbi:FAD-dependent oxidoreductase [Synechocystis sp. B12]|nr:FAD-dependent oxidoreductase [Synechocystis sp. B12]